MMSQKQEWKPETAPQHREEAASFAPVPRVSAEGLLGGKRWPDTQSKERGPPRVTSAEATESATALTVAWP